MAQPRWPSRGRHLRLFLVAGLLSTLLPANVAQVSPQQSAKAEADLICHTPDPEDGYPRIFVPTDEFQAVHDDQEIPKGLHVRLDIWTGKKEAKLNVPDERDPAVEGLPGDKAVVVVGAGSKEDDNEDDVAPIPKNAPRYEAFGKVKKPEQDSELFAIALDRLMQGATPGDGAFDKALETLEELSHDLYYGLKMLEKPAIAKKLFCLMAGQDASQTQTGQGETMVPRDQQAASILAGALRYNPGALKQVTKIWPEVKEHACPLTATADVRDTLFSNLVPRDGANGPRAAQASQLTKAKISVINGLIQDASIRRYFVDSGGMGGLAEVLVPEGREWQGAQRKAGQLVLERFLDADLGAELGLWPRTAKLSDEQCRGAESAGQEGCWDYHVARIQRTNGERLNGGHDDEEHWSRQVKDRLAAARNKVRGKGQGAQEDDGKHSEL